MSWRSSSRKRTRAVWPHGAGSAYYSSSYGYYTTNYQRGGGGDARYKRAGVKRRRLPQLVFVAPAVASDPSEGSSGSAVP